MLKYFRERLEGANNPRQFGKPLVGDKAGFWRYRIGDYRAICHLEDQVLTILVFLNADKSRCTQMRGNMEDGP
ncbi:type II toxin-antitoxin system RelE family toxin [Geoalkalibacter halelectricus]|uniref:type II toxin-antitoxin system RelE family toxin n=1 Tax=Geoalkalibacter halelectricus TaxID=2847045 RepID=UPI0036F279AD